MILLTLDPLSKTAGMLSIPRDLWVSIPGFKHGKINTAYYLGDAYELPGGGPALAVKTVEQFLGVPINYYAQIDFGAFVRFIDEVGGVKIDVPEPITIDLLGTGHQTKKKLTPGEQVLPGEWALAYARARYTEGGDFDRAKRQQQVIMAIRDRILSFDLLPTLISKAPQLYNELASGINTNLSLDEVIKLAWLAVEVQDENIYRGIIDESNVYFGTSPDGLSILIPIPDDIHLLRDQIFAASAGLGPETPGDPRQQMQAESARIAVYNGSSTPGLAERTADYLRSQGANIVQVGNTDYYAATTIIDHSGSPYALKYLVDLMGISSGKIYIRFDPNSAVDVELFLGDDWARQNTLP
jgi:LCP family protein required for cell wall assembly